MSIEIVASSPKAQEMAAKKPVEKRNYPFEDLNVGQSFTTKIAETNVKSLRVMASQKSKDGKRFVMVKHDDLGICEVARVE